MKCINLAPCCSRSACKCDEVRNMLIQTMTNLVTRSRAFHRGLRHEMYDDGQSQHEIPIDEKRVVSLEECNRIDNWIAQELDPMKMEIEYEIKVELENKKRQELKKKLLKGIGLYQVGWITISCPKDYSPATMLKKTQRLLKSKQFSDCMCVLEFTGKEQQYHPHLHLLVNEKQAKNKNLRDIGRVFDINYKNSKFVDYKSLKTRSAIEEKIKYIHGDKQDLKKLQVEKDEFVRSSNDIPDFFSQGNIYGQELDFS